MKMAFVERSKSKTTCTTTYKSTFPFSSANTDAFWDTVSLKNSLKSIITQFAEEVLLKSIKAKTGQPVWCVTCDLASQDRELCCFHVLAKHDVGTLAQSQAPPARRLHQHTDVSRLVMLCSGLPT